MNARNVLLIIAAILAPGGVLLLAPLIYRWIKQRRNAGAANVMSPAAEGLQPALPERP